MMPLMIHLMSSGPRQRGLAPYVQYLIPHLSMQDTRSWLLAAGNMMNAMVLQFWPLALGSLTK